MTIPDDMLAEAVRIYNEDVGFEYASPLALEAVLLTFLPLAWDEGYGACASDVNHSANWFDETANPYKED